MPETDQVATRRAPLLRRGWLLWSVAAVVAVVLVAVWLFGGSEPPAVDAERAVERGDDATDGPAAPATPGSSEDAGSDGFGARDLTGTWTVDTSRAFDRDEGTGSFVGYRVAEELAGVGAQTAVGRSPAVDGTVAIAGTTVSAVRVQADLTALESDDGRRDNRVRSTLGPGATASFELAGPLELGEIPPVGEVVELWAEGTLTILDTPRDVEVALQAVVTDDELVVTGTVAIELTDFDVEAPTAPIVLSVSDEATLEWQLFLARTA